MGVRGPVALFPGQGSQKVGMGGDLVARYPDLEQRWFARADEVLDLPLSQLCFEGPAEALRSTDVTQPALFVVSMAVLDVLRRAGVEPVAAAGHSLGEYSALCCAGAVPFEVALRLVRRRGELMAAANARTPGAMAAIVGLDLAAVEELCAEAAAATGGVVEPANENEPAQTVISGERDAVAHASTAAAGRGARAVPLDVGAPFHCSLLGDVAEEFAADLDAAPFADPQLPVVANATAQYVRTAGEVRAALRRQVAGRVRWVATMERLAGDGHRTFVECGPGRVLSGFATRTVPGADVHAAGDVRRLDAAVAALAGDGAG